jgi:hypothetical protein
MGEPNEFETEQETKPDQRSMAQLYEDWLKAKREAEESGIAFSERPTRPVTRQWY